MCPPRIPAWAVVAIALGVSGCAAPMTEWAGSNSGGGEAGLFRTAEVRAFDRSPQAPLEIDRFEFSRRDALSNPVAFGPVTASRQWPQAPVPAERRIRFWIWEQR